MFAGQCFELLIVQFRIFADFTKKLGVPAV